MTARAAFAVGLAMASVTLSACVAPDTHQLPVQSESQAEQDIVPPEYFEQIDTPIEADSTRLVGEAGGATFYVGSSKTSQGLICLIGLVSDDTYAACSDRLPIKMGADELFEAELWQQRPPDDPAGAGEWLNEHLWVSMK